MMTSRLSGTMFQQLRQLGDVCCYASRASLSRLSLNNRIPPSLEKSGIIGGNGIEYRSNS